MASYNSIKTLVKMYVFFSKASGFQLSLLRYMQETIKEHFWSL